jgi:hypothetical protein
VVVIALERRPGGVNDERRENEEDEERLDPPRVPPLGLAEGSGFGGDLRLTHQQPPGGVTISARSEVFNRLCSLPCSLPWGARFLARLLDKNRELAYKGAFRRIQPEDP